MLIWVFAWYFHLGATGPWSDDWFFQFTSPETGEPHRYAVMNWTTKHHRPLHHMFMPFLETFFADARWFAVFVSVVGHGLCALLLWLLLKGLGFTRLPRDAGALAWLVYPVIFDIPLWVAAVSTGYALALALLVLLGCMRIAKGGSLWLAVPIGLAAYTVCALNEQPASLFAAIPIMTIACADSWKARLRATLVPTFACVIGVGAYLVLSMGLVPGVSDGLSDVERGSSARLITSGAELRDSWNLTRDQANSAMLMQNGFLRGALKLGWSALKTGPLHAGWGFSLIWIALIAFAAALRLPRLRSECRESKPMRWQDATRQGFVGGLLGLVVFFAGLVPVLIIHDQDFYTRLACVPAIGLAIWFATVLEILLRNAMLSRRLGVAVRIGVVVCTGALVAVWSVACIGMQEGLHRRVLQDRSEAAQLARLVPDPPEGAVIVFCSYNHRVAQTGHPQTNRKFPGAVNVTWATTRFVQRAYKRWDVLGIGVWYTSRPPVLSVDDRGLQLDPAMVHDTTMNFLNPPLPEPYVVPWDRAVLVGVDSEGTVHRITRAELEPMVARRHR
ncbi:MAG: hypothetical protein ED559_13460 [Phycisphaera sp.]|nr:MAG: hypothetical protein ED559_13460 [Phycisphaera sp.]